MAFVVLVLGASAVFGFVAWDQWYRYGWPVAGTERPAAFVIRGDSMGLLRFAGEGSVEVAVLDLKSDSTAVVYSGAGDGRAIAMDDDWVVWSACDERGVMPCAGHTFATKRDGGAPHEVFAQALSPIVAMGGAVYGLDVRGNLYGGTPDAVLAPVPVSGEAHALASTEDDLYVLSNASLEVREKGGELRSIGPGCANGGKLTATDRGVYVACESLVGPDPIDLVPLDGSARLHIGDAIKVEALQSTPRGLVVIFETPDPEQPGSSASTLGIFPKPGAPLSVLLDRSGWGPLGVYDGKLYLLEYRALAVRRLP